MDLYIEYYLIFKAHPVSSNYIWNYCVWPDSINTLNSITLALLICIPVEYTRRCVIYS